MILIAFVLLVPKGIVPTLGDWGLTLLRLRGRRATKRLEPTAAE
jgi:branched-chain amino acid transport system permease protein